MKFRRRQPVRARRRRGLAPLELVLYLPIMLFVMALMINFGTMAAWKVRSQVNTRYAATRSLRDRTGDNNPSPENWPANATLRSSGGDDVTQPNRIWNRSRYLTTPVVRGPVIVDPNEGRTITVVGRFNMQERTHAGEGNLERRLPLLRSMMRNDGQYRFNQRMDLLDNRWEYRHLVTPANPLDRRDVPGDNGNERRRAKRWYRIEPDHFPEVVGDLQALMAADQRLKSFPLRFDLDPLDYDPEVIQFQIRRIMGDDFQGPLPPRHPVWRRINPPDFHQSIDATPMPGRNLDGCNPLVFDPERQQRLMQNAVDTVQRLPGRMGRYFRGQYNQEISRLRGRVESLRQQIAALQMMNPPPAGQIGELQGQMGRYNAEIRRLETLLNQVSRFLSTLPRQYR